MVSGMGFGVNDVAVGDFADVAEVGVPCELFHAFLAAEYGAQVFAGVCVCPHAFQRGFGD